MKLDDILILLKAGYTKEDIDKLQAPTPAPTPAPAPVPTPDPKPAPAPDPAQAIKTVLDDFTKKLQAFQVATSNLPPRPDDTGESVFAEIIAPTKRKE